MAEDEQHAAVMAMWQTAMIQIGEDPDKLTGDRATAQNEHTDDGHGALTGPWWSWSGPVRRRMEDVPVGVVADGGQ